VSPLHRSAHLVRRSYLSCISASSSGWLLTRYARKHDHLAQRNLRSRKDCDSKRINRPAAPVADLRHRGSWAHAPPRPRCRDCPRLPRLATPGEDGSLPQPHKSSTTSAAFSSSPSQFLSIGTGKRSALAWKRPASHCITSSSTPNVANSSAASKQTPANPIRHGGWTTSMTLTWPAHGTAKKPIPSTPPLCCHIKSQPLSLIKVGCDDVAGRCLPGFGTPGIISRDVIERIGVGADAARLATVQAGDRVHFSAVEAEVEDVEIRLDPLGVH
jgi:hypothetical protein